jgi:outer membrane receptor protein involved in Fe transport
MINIRGAYSVSVSRPELREIAPTVYVDWSTFTTTVGNPDSLDRTLIQNYDIRVEAFPEAGEILSLSLFYKHFDAPIEESFLPRTGSEKLKSFFNATNGAKNYGVEIEARKKLGFITKYLKDFALLANVTFVQSQVRLDGVTSVATEKSRRMQGQSPYMLNVGLFYDNYEIGTSINLLFNRIGDRISEVGLQGTQSIYEKGRSVLDFTVTQRLFKYLELKFAAKDILNKDIIYTQVVNNVEQVVRRLNTGSNYSLILSIKY